MTTKNLTLIFNANSEGLELANGLMQQIRAIEGLEETRYPKIHATLTPKADTEVQLHDVVHRLGEQYTLALATNNGTLHATKAAMARNLETLQGLSRDTMFESCEMSVRINLENIPEDKIPSIMAILEAHEKKDEITVQEAELGMT